MDNGPRDEGHAVVGALYRHFKSGNIYKIEAIVRWEPDPEDCVVIYRQWPYNDNDIPWARLRSVWVQQVEWSNGKLYQRFLPLHLAFSQGF